jgi:hypothetical protein
MSGVPYIFANATTSIPLSELDSNFATPVYIGNASVALGNTVTSIGNVTLTNVTISSGNVTATSVVAPTIGSASGSSLSLQSNGTTNATLDTNGRFIVTTANGGSYDSTAPGIYFQKQSSTSEASVPFIRSQSNGSTTTDLALGPSSTSGRLLFYTDGNNVGLFDSSGNLGVGGTTSPWYSTAKAIQIGLGASFSVLNLSATQNAVTCNAYYNGSNWVYQNTASASIYDFNNAATGGWAWRIAPSGTAGNSISGANAFVQAMTLDASGNLLVGKTSASDSVVGAYISPSGSFSQTNAASTNSTVVNAVYSSGASNYRFYVGMGGTVYATSTSITAISDQTLKTNIKPLETGLAEINKLQPRRFDWINGDGTNVAGFISQEVQTVLPDLVSESIYSYAEDGSNINKLYLKMGDMIPTMVNAIQQLSAQVTTLQAQVTALQAKVGT